MARKVAVDIAVRVPAEIKWAARKDVSTRPAAEDATVEIERVRVAGAHERDVVPGIERELETGLAYGAVVSKDETAAAGAATAAAYARKECTKATRVNVLADAKLVTFVCVAD